MIYAAFVGWQYFHGQGIKIGNWEQYLIKLGLQEKEKITDSGIKKEREQAMKNVERIIEKARKLNMKVEKNG